MPPLDLTPDGVRLTLHIQPGASRTELAGRHGDAIKIRVAAPPVDGAANAELVSFLAHRLGVPRSAVVIRHGESGRRKTIEIRGLSLTQAGQKLELGMG
jgi:uncharacterized protein (TIGR00251 family)